MFLNDLFVEVIFNQMSFMRQSRSLFVKNLNFKTSGESLRKHFSEHMKEGKIRSVRVILLHLITFAIYSLITFGSCFIVPGCPCAGEGALEKWQECVNGFWVYRVWFSWNSSQCLQQFTGNISCKILLHLLKQCIPNVPCLSGYCAGWPCSYPATMPCQEGWSSTEKGW